MKRAIASVSSMNISGLSGIPISRSTTVKSADGVRIAGIGSTGNKLHTNFLGTASGGNLSIFNRFAGAIILNRATGNPFGEGPGSGNLISGNGTVGVLIADLGTTGNFVCHNRIGSGAVAGTSFIDQFDGVWLTAGATANTIGGTSPGAANVITGNPGRGIVLFEGPTAGQSFRRNSIFANGWQGIALYDGSNHSQVSPVIASAVLGSGTTITGNLTSTPGTDFMLEFSASPGARDFIGQHPVETSPGSSMRFNVTLPAIVAAGPEIVITATSMVTGDSDGLPNAYESTTPGLNPANPLDAVLDNDGDGFTNLQEFVAGTHPNNPTSRLVTTGAMVGGNFQITSESVAGKFYRVERSDSVSGAWQTVALNVEGTGSSVQVAVPVSLSRPRQFFRVTAGE